MPYKDPVRRAEYNKTAQKKYYRKHKDVWLEHNRAVRRYLSDLVTQLKMGQICADCKKEYPYYVLDFHHRAGIEKLGVISRIIADTSSERLLLEEIAKCDLICSNCHRERTYGPVG